MPSNSTSAFEFFLPGSGINEDIIAEVLAKYCGRDHQYKKATKNEVSGWYIRSARRPRALEEMQRELKETSAKASSNRRRKPESQYSDSSDTDGSCYSSEDDSQCDDEDEEDNSFWTRDRKTKMGLIAAVGVAGVVAMAARNSHQDKQRTRRHARKQPLRISRHDNLPPSRSSPTNQFPSDGSDMYQPRRRDFEANASLKTPTERHANLLTDFAALDTKDHREYPALPMSPSRHGPAPRPALSRANTEPLPRHIIQFQTPTGNTNRIVLGSARHRPSGSDIGNVKALDRVVLPPRTAVSESGLTYQTLEDNTVMLRTRLRQVHCGATDGFTVNAYLDSGAVENLISDEFYELLAPRGIATKVNPSLAIEMEAGGHELQVLGQTKFDLWWFAEKDERRDTRLKFQVVVGLYPHMIFKERTIVDFKMRDYADAWPEADRRQNLMFNLPRAGTRKREQDALEHQRKKEAHIARAAQEQREQARQREHDRQRECDRQSRSSKNSNSSSRSRHSRR